MTNSTVSAEQAREALSEALTEILLACGDDENTTMPEFRDLVLRRYDELIAQHSTEPVAAGWSRNELAALIAGELAEIDGFDAADEHGGLYDLRWSGGHNPEPLGDAWNMDYMPKGERIAEAIRRRFAAQGQTP